MIRSKEPQLVGARTVWGGRWSSEVPGALDGWNCDRTALLSALDDTAELVILDAPSFPWDALRSRDRDIPVVVALPGDLDGETIGALLGEVLLRHVTPFDVLVEHRAEVRAHLSRRWMIDDEVWLTSDAPGGVPEACQALTSRSAARLTEVQTDLGVFRAQREDLVTRQLQEFGAHQRGTLNVLLTVLRPDDVVLDVGAHIGTFTVPLANRLRPPGIVYAVEGSRESLGLLKDNVLRNGVADLVKILPAVVGPPGDHHYVFDSQFGNTGGSSFRLAAWRTLGAQQAVTLDDLLLDHPDLRRTTILKMDIEGSELDALRGAESLITSARPALVLEVSPGQLRQRRASPKALERWLTEHSYRLLKISGDRNTRNLTWEVTPIAGLDHNGQELFDVLALPAESHRFDDLPMRGSVD